ncbi:hypothetical protein [Candidatus Phycosocius spiralis]|uniref:3-oxoacyl-ACP synthase n=1 Tax=Candidatus Phycosocius spiralis TaxID=2815099 RepID=A0ABQ4PW08_9PROT|nr:hypothetical protein [Candidatus Phycosocius spiralis]GIU67183.1 hypothetical protein PsB1_1337 [Candidatus Phycosocius spiralis]
MKEATLDDLKSMRARGQLLHDPEAPDGPDLGSAFWADAVIQEPTPRKSVHLRLNSEVYDFFLKQSDGKGHIKKMQQVLKAYADAHK